MYGKKGVISKWQGKRLVRYFSDVVLLLQFALELISPVTLMLEISDREPHRINEMLEQIDAHLTHFINVYGIMWLITYIPNSRKYVCSDEKLGWTKRIIKKIKSRLFGFFGRG